MTMIRRLSIIVFFLAGLGFADQGLILREAYGDFITLGIQSGRVYIFTGEKFHVFDIEDGKPLHQFGRVGQGPGEYGDYFVFPFYSSEGIFINNMGKFIQYSLDGKFLRTILSKLQYDFLLPLGDRFAVRAKEIDLSGVKNEEAVQIVDDGLNLVREIYRQKNKSFALGKDGVLRVTQPSSSVEFRTEGGKLYVLVPAEDLSIAVYDRQGGLLRSFQRKIEKIKIPEEERVKLAENARSADTPRMRVERVVADYYPAFHFFAVDQGLIYIFTYNRRGDKREVLVMDENGDLLKSAWLTRVAAARSCVYQKKFYYVVDDEKSGELVLHSEPIF